MVNNADANYLQASYNGMTFATLNLEDIGLGTNSIRSEFNNSSLEAGRRGVIHEFPYYDIPYFEDMGRKARRFNIIAVFQGDDHQDQTNKFIENVEKQAIAELVHPQHGIIDVVPLTIEISNNNKSIGVTTLTMSLIEAGEYTQPIADTIYRYGPIENSTKTVTELVKQIPDADPKNIDDALAALEIMRDITTSDSGFGQAVNIYPTVIGSDDVADLGYTRILRLINEPGNLNSTALSGVNIPPGSSSTVIETIVRETIDRIIADEDLSRQEVVVLRRNVLGFIDRFQPSTSEEIEDIQFLRRSANILLNQEISDSFIEYYIANGEFQPIPIAYQEGFGVIPPEIDAIDYDGDNPMFSLGVRRRGNGVNVRTENDTRFFPNSFGRIVSNIF